MVNSYSVISQLSTFIQQSISDADNQAAIANIRSRIEVTDQKVKEKTESLSELNFIIFYSFWTYLEGLINF